MLALLLTLMVLQSSGHLLVHCGLFGCKLMNFQKKKKVVSHIKIGDVYSCTLSLVG